MSESSISDESPFTSQRIFASVYAVTDNPPMTYEWISTGGVLDVPETAPHATYWTAPSEPGAYTITCKITDKEKKQVTRIFHVQVRARVLMGNLTGSDREAITLTKESDSNIGGVWVSIKNNRLRYISATMNEESIWAKDFSAMLARSDELTQQYTIWGIDSMGKNITVLTSATASTLTCVTCFYTNTINCLAKDVLDSSILWVGTDYGLNSYNSSTDTWDRYLNQQVNDLVEGPYYTYAATDNGVYRLDGVREPISGGYTCSVMAFENGTSTEVWSVAGEVLQKDGRRFSTQPPAVSCSLDRDLSGNIWCGKYWWDGAQWHVVPGLEGIKIVKSVASPEGLVYFLSDSGGLYRW